MDEILLTDTILEENTMKQYGLNELRKMFLDFFASKGHLVRGSYSLVPHNDKSVLLIIAGMAPLKPYFTGQEIPPSTRMATCQKCIRTSDIENIGKTARHGTFFEMLGNFSFGDYFKKESIPWAWEFLTEVVGLDANRLYPTVYKDDDEAFDIWHHQIGISKDRIFRFGKEDNFWEHGAGPCGPCSEIFYDRGEKYGCGKPDCTVGCDCDRFIEIWNIVFTQFDNDGKGHYEPLEQKNIDTGMGLERLATVVQDVDSIFDVDTIKALRDRVSEITGKEYHKKEQWDVSIRIITDHIRSATFMISDGIMPSNEGRGYVLRRLIRRAARHGKLLGRNEQFLAELSKTVIESSKDGYPELEEKKTMIFKVLTEEENKFYKTIDTGLRILSEMEKKLEQSGSGVLSGEDAFKLYDTFGFPLDLTEEILEEKGYTVDEDGFQKAMNVQKETARKARKKTNYMGADATVYEQLDLALHSAFVGYDRLMEDSVILALTTEEEVVQALAEGDRGTIVAEQTPFYATMGGQLGDRGIIISNHGVFEVTETIKLPGDKIGHLGTVKSGMLQTGDQITLKVDSNSRSATAKNHSATHLLQKSLKLVLGDHVEQAGSYVDADRLRFDFTHFQAMTKEEIEKVEALVNEQIANGLDVVTREMNLDDARKSGATALFGEKYGEVVRVVSMGDYSVELCGGTHVSNTGTISSFKIISESGVAAGVRRIEALTGNGVLKYYAQIEKELHSAAKAAKTTPAELVKKIQSMNDEIKLLSGENEKLKAKMANASVGDALNQVTEVSGVKLLALKVSDVDMNELRNLGDNLKEKMGGGVLVLVSTNADRANVLVMADDDAVAKGAHAGNMIKEIAKLVGGGGGGRPNMAQAGGKNPAGADAAVKAAKEILEKQL